MVFAAISTIFCYPLYLLLKKIKEKTGRWFAFRFTRFWFRVLIFTCGVHVTYKGLEHLPEEGNAVVFMGNHRSIFDVILTYPVFKSPTGIFAKKELEKTPLVGWWVKSLYGIFLDRNDTRQGLKCILEGIEYLKSGISMTIFPEGSRCKEEAQVMPFHGGSFKLATKTGLPIIPIAISNTGNIFDDHVPFVKSQKVTVEFLNPVNTDRLSREEITALPETVRTQILSAQSAILFQDI